MSANNEKQDAQEPGLLHHIYASFAATIALIVVLCGAYPLIVWGIGQVVFADKANGSLIKDASGNVIGSSLIGQPFTMDKYFHPRPSSASYDPTNSQGSNLGPTSAKLLYGTTKQDSNKNDIVDFDGIRDRVVHYITENNLPYTSSAPLTGFKDAQGNLDDVKLIKAFNDPNTPLVVTPQKPIPADAVTGSGSGLDPHISIDNASIQAARVAKARNVSVDKVTALIQQNTDGPDLGILGDAGVNVVKLNVALDKAYPAQ
jgi:K+-transporting ATPase ATPase C chain